MRLYVYKCQDMANLRVRRRRKSNIDIPYLGMSRKKNRTQHACRNRHKHDDKRENNNLSRIEIPEQHYTDVDKELRN